MALQKNYLSLSSPTKGPGAAYKGGRVGVRNFGKVRYLVKARLNDPLEEEKRYQALLFSLKGGGGTAEAELIEGW